MKLRRKPLALVVALCAAALLAVVAVLAARAASPQVAWRVDVLVAKLRGDLPAIPLRSLLAWLMPGSPVYLQPLADSPNPHAGVRNLLTGPDDLKRGAELYTRQCAACHGERGRGLTGPDLVAAVSAKSDWAFFSAARWGLPGTAMIAQPLADHDLWRVHAFLRGEALAQAARAEDTPERPAVAVDPQRILQPAQYPGEWLTYAGNYAGHRHSGLAQIDRSNVGSLQVAWVAQLPQVDRELQTSPLVADGTMFVTESKSGVVALDARTGAQRWAWRPQVPDGLPLCCGMPNRGAAVLGKLVYVATIDGLLVALDTERGKPRWQARVADPRDGYSLTGAPLALPDRIVVGVAGGEFGARGFIAAFDPADGRRLWTFWTVPGPGEFGHDSWGGDSWRTGGAPTWVTGAYDPDQDLLFWGAGNPAPTYQASARPGDNLFSNSVVALEAKTGKLRWHYQFTPADEHDWDSAQQPILAEIPWQGAPRKVLLWANRNGFFYALDRATGTFLFARPFVKQTWNEGFDSHGRPKVAATARPTPQGAIVWPAMMAATNWWPPSYDPQRQLVFVPSSDAAGVFFRSDRVAFERGARYEGSTATPYSPNLPAAAYVKAIDAATGAVRWQTTLASGSGDFVWAVGGVLSTAGGVAFSGYRDHFHAFDADTGHELWKVNLGARVRGSPITFQLDGRQYVTVTAGSSVFTFAAPRSPATRARPAPRPAAGGSGRGAGSR